MLRPFFFVMCALVSASSAMAAERSKVVVAPWVAREGATESATAKFTQQLNEELRTRGSSLEVLSPPVTRTGTAAPAARKGMNPDVQAALDLGKKAFDDLRFDDAIKSLRRAIDGMVSDPANADFVALSDAYVKLAAAHFRLGDEKEAKATLTDFARLFPLAMVPAGFPPVFQRELDKAKKRVEKLPHGQISVEGPSGSAVFVDGRDIGSAPALDENLAAGMHSVRVENARGERWGQAIEVKNGVAKVRAFFAASSPDRAPMTSDPHVGSPVDEPMVSRIQSFSKAAGADFALIGVVTKLDDAHSQASAALYSLQKNGVSMLTPIAFETGTVAGAELSKLVDEVVRRAASFGAATALPIDLTLHKASVAVAGARLSPKPSLGSTGPMPAAGGLSERPDEELREDLKTQSGVPAWVWVVTGIAVAGGAAAGGYFIVKDVTKPVTGTVQATW